MSRSQNFGFDEQPYHPSIEDSYPLSQLQLGMLFHSLDDNNTGVDIEQIICDLDEDLTVPHFLKALQRIVDRHPILRSSYHYEGAAESVQNVHCQVTMPIELLDWSRYDSTDQKTRWQSLLAEDRERRFDLRQPSPARVTLLKMGTRSHRLLWTYHHILLDGRSLMLLLRELFTFYAALRDGTEVEIPLPRPYGDYVRWLRGKEFTLEKTFWQNFLEGFRAPTPLIVPQQPGSEPLGGQGYGCIETTLSQEITDKLKAFAQQQRVTVNTLLQSAWALLLHHYSGESDIVFGAARACRHSAIPGTLEMVGLFINTLPMRVKLDPLAELSGLLQHFRAQQVELRDYEQTPLALVQGWSEVRGGTALFDSIIVFENYLLNTTLRSEGGEWLNRRVHYLSQTNYPVTIEAFNDAEFYLRITFQRQRFDDEAMRRMSLHLCTLLKNMADDPHRALGQIPFVTAQERDHLLSNCGQSTVQFSPYLCVHELFEAQVERSPLAIAVSLGAQNLTYRELNQRANHVAHRLRSLGVGPDVLVGLCVERSLTLIVGILAIMKAGGAYLPLDPNYPAERLAFMLNDAQVALLITEEKFLQDNRLKIAGEDCLSSMIDAGTQIISLDQEWDKTSPASNNNIANSTGPDNLAYVIYTSGSTGKPKGALVTHYNVVRLFQATEADFQFNSSDVWTLFHSYAFDFSVWEIWGALLYGGRLVVVPHAISRAPDEFASLLKEQGVTVLNQTPSAFRQLIPHFLATVAPDKLLLRYVIFGGEALELQSLTSWFNRYGDRKPRVINMYGITETTVHVTYRPIQQSDLNAHTGSVIGKPLADLQIYLLNPHQEPVPLGVPGEIYVGGAGVARGYWQRPELTAEKFVDNPFNNETQSKLYRSGDLARWLPTGELEYLGRIDHQVKIRGFRIELGEIEAALGQHPAVREVAVMARDDRPSDPQVSLRHASTALSTGKRLVAYFVAADEPGQVSSDELRNHLRALLPDHMIPSAFIRLVGLPLTAHGKVDRQALPAPDLDRPELQQQYVAPRGAVDTALCKIWSSVLGVEKVGIHDNFFALGGDSILSIQVIAQARKAGLKVSPGDLFKNPTVAELTEVCPVFAILHREEARAEGDVLLTPIQQWFFEQQLADGQHWNQSFLFETLTKLDLTVLEAALQFLVDHHDSFRLRYSLGASGYRQHYEAAPPRVTVERIDLSEFPHAEQEGALIAAASERQSGLNITDGPILQATYYQLGPGMHGRLLLVAHHLAIDGVSWPILLQDLETAYLSLRAKKTVQLAAKTSSFQNWAKHLCEFANSDAVCAEFSYWREVTGQVAPLPIELDREAANIESFARTVSVRLNAGESRALLQAPTVLRAQINDLLLTALAEAFSDWPGLGSLLVDVEGHGREDISEAIDVSRTIGWFTTIFPVRLDPKPGVSIAERLRQMKGELRRMPRHGIGYGALRYLSSDDSIRGALAAQPQACVAFNYLGQFDQWLADSALFAFAKETCGPWHGPANQRRHALEVIAVMKGGCFEVHWTYSEHWHREETIARVAEKFLGALRVMIAAKDNLAAQALIPADFPLAAIDQVELDRIAGDYPGLEDMYSLSPMQRLFLSMESASADLGFEQWHYILEGPLDADAFRQAWQQVAARHPVLRTGFISIGLREPVQIVLRQVSLPWVEYDWRIHPTEQQEKLLVEFLRQDREQSFDSSQAPLLRLTLVRTAEETHYLIWTTHHLLIDGWSWPLIFKELSEFYLACRTSHEVQLDFTCRYRDYIAWLAAQPKPAAESFWRERLAGITAATSLGFANRKKTRGPMAEFREASARIPANSTAALQTLARANQITLNTIAQGAWGLLLSRYSGAADVLFGAAVSGRPAELPGVGAMVGPCINDVPVRVKVESSEYLGTWLKRLQEDQMAASQYQQSSLEDIHNWSQVPLRDRLFDSLLVFQNYLVGSTGHQLGSDVMVRAVAIPETTNYPITLMIVPGASLQLKIIYRQSQFTGESIGNVLREMQMLLEAMIGSSGCSLAELLAELPPLPKPEVNDDLVPEAIERTTAEFSDIASKPRTECERIVASIWRTLFQTDEVPLDINFFDFGGHSLLLLQLHKSLQHSLKRAIPLVALFQHATVHAMARYLDEAGPLATNADNYQLRARQQRQALAQRSNTVRRT